MNKIIDAINENRIASAPGYRLKRTAHGTGLEIEVPQPAPAAAGGGITFRGEWTNQAYDEDDLVVIRGGTSAGLYIAVTAVPLNAGAPSHIPSDPGATVYWVQLAPGNTLGFW